MDNLEELNTDKILAMSVTDKKDYMSRIRIKYKRLLDIKDKILSCFNSSKTSQEPECINIVGPMGSGKSTLLDLVMEEQTTYEKELTTISHTIRATVFPDPSVKSFLMCIRFAMKEPGWNKGTKGSMIGQIQLKSKECEIQNIVLDEIQHMVDRYSKLVLPDVSDLLKYFIKECHWSTVLCGLEGEAEEIIAANPQLFRLFPDPVILEPFSWDINNKATIEEFKTLLFEIEKKMPFKNRSHLDDEKIAWPIFYASQGLISWTMLLLRAAGKRALDGDSDFISVDDLKFSFDEKLAGKRRGLINPFVTEPEYPAPPLPKLVQFDERATNKRAGRRKPRVTKASDIL